MLVGQIEEKIINYLRLDSNRVTNAAKKHLHILPKDPMLELEGINVLQYILKYVCHVGFLSLIVFYTRS